MFSLPIALRTDISAGDLLFSVPMDQAITITKAISRFGGILPSVTIPPPTYSAKAKYPYFV